MSCKLGQHCAELIHSVRRQAFNAVLYKELLQALVDEVPYYHYLHCSLLPYARQSNVGTQVPAKISPIFE